MEIQLQKQQVMFERLLNAGFIPNNNITMSGSTNMSLGTEIWAFKSSLAISSVLPLEAPQLPMSSIVQHNMQSFDNVYRPQLRTTTLVTMF